MAETQGLSTKTINKWPDAKKLKKICESLAVLSWIQMDLERFFIRSAGGKTTFLFSNGEGDTAEIYFDDSGAIVKGFAHECIYAFWGAEDCPWPKEDGEWLPNDFRSYWEENIEDEDLSFIAWYLNKDKKWSNLDLTTADREEVVNETGDEDPNGSIMIWDSLPMTPELYAKWEGKDLGIKFDPKAVESIYNHEPLTKEIILRLNPKFDFTDKKHQEVLKGITYPSKL